MTTDPTAAIEVLARLLCAADVHVHDGDHPTWQQLRVAQHGRGQDDYRKAARWLLPRMTVATRPAAVPVAAPPVAVDSSEDRCAECGHFRGAHEEAEEPVSVGRCTVCADEDEWHGFEAVEESPVAAPPTTEQTADDTVRCPLCADARPLHTPAEAHEHFGSAHPEQPLTGPGPWPMLGVPPVPAGRAATLREAADAIKALDRRKIGIEADTIKDAWEEGRDEGADLLRAMAVEAGQASEGQPETPLEKRLRYSERRNDELRAECKRRGKTVLEQAEKIVALERQIDEVRSQLGAEILRAGQAEAELRRLADEEQAGGPSREATEWLAAAKFVEAMNEGCDNRRPCESCTTREDVAAELRRGAAEPQPEAQHVCEPGATAYYCPTSGQAESDCHGGFTTCCDRPDLHHAPAVSSRPGTEQEA